jgi:hypothetical protein
VQNEPNVARPGPGSSKSEARNPKQIQIANDTNGGKRGEMRGFGTFAFRSLELVSDFEIRASNLARAGADARGERAKRTQFGRSARRQNAKCAKRTQFGAGGRGELSVVSCQFSVEEQWSSALPSSLRSSASSAVREDVDSRPFDCAQGRPFAGMTNGVRCTPYRSKKETMKRAESAWAKAHPTSVLGPRSSVLHYMEAEGPPARRGAAG